MMKANEHIMLTSIEAIEILKEINLILISLHDMGAYYMDADRKEYERETTRFIDDNKITSRLAKVRYILSDKFDDTVGADDMDDIERAMEGLKYWLSPGDNLEDLVE